ncbi:MAG: multidrug transporter AcrB [Alphaproteobacteria bacterium]|jgi:HAE1 family hydrophobic/amphiphilic exporter-1/multidrug efflux pump|nr:efflux RND transporter permease subunit [Pelagibacterales bacterium]RUA20227.1 MAG: multidrug transporter AcrB [Alphaproteobacteria bacterium]
MYITELSIKRPVVAAVFSMILVVFGLFVFSKLPVRELPSGLQPPVIQVQVNYEGASAEIISSEIVEILEDVIGGVEGVKHIDSTAQIGRAEIKIEFETSIDLDVAANDVREKISRVADNLPQDAKAPEILKQSSGFTTTMWVSVSGSEKWSDLELGDYSRRFLIDSFANIKGVGRVLLGGLRSLSVRVYINPVLLAANDLTIQEVEQALRRENMSLPAGSFDGPNLELSISVDKAYKDLSSIKQLPIKKVKNSVIRLENIAEVKFGPENEKTLFKAQGKDGNPNEKIVGIGIYAKSDASTVELSKRIKKRIKEIQKTLPDGLKLGIAFDRSTFIKASIFEIWKTLFIAFILVVIIIYLFLGNLKAVIVPAVALPISLISSFLGLWIFDLSINVFVLLSFILAIGIITDDSVIMTDAIYHRIENGETPLVASLRGAESITFAIISTTLVLVAVFLPLIFIEGISGTLFRETAITLTFAIVVSSFVALTLSPMLASKFLNKNMKKTKIVLKFEKYYKSFLEFYTETLNYWISKPKVIIGFMFSVVIASVLLFNFAPKELLPQEDRGVYLIVGQTDIGSSYQYTVDKAEKIERRLIPLVENEDESYKRLVLRVPGWGTGNSYNSFIIIALLDDWKDRNESAQKIMRKAMGKIVTLPQTLAFPISPQSIRVSQFRKPIQLVLQGKSYEELERWQKLIMMELRKNKNLAAIESDFSRQNPEVKFIINRKKAQDLGVSIQSINETVQTLFSGKTVTKFNQMGKEYPIILQAGIENRKKSENLTKIFVRSSTTGKLISLANLVEFEEVGSAKILARYDRQRAVTISARLVGDYTLSEALSYLEKTVNENVPEARIEWKGKSEELKETSNELFIIFALALLTAFLVMAANFNSFIHPVVIFLTVPLSIFGGIIFILLFNSSINIFSQIALVILIGISTKNSILIVDWANQLRRAGKNIQSAALEACRRRFRAIIMTSLSTMIAMVPLLVGNIGPGAGEGSRLAVGATIFGGMLISTFFTLYVTPTMYVLLTKNTKRIDAVDLQLNKELKR